MSQKEEIGNFIWSFINPNEEECGWIEFNDKNTKELQSKGYEFDCDSVSYNGEYIGSGLSAVLHLAELKFGVKFEYDDIGGFDSPGYDIECYAWACITKDGELYFDSTTRESY